MPTIPSEAFDALPKSIRSYMRFLEATIQQQQATIQQQQATIQQQQVHIEELQVQVRDLKVRLSKNSLSSSKPPSSDGLKKPPKSQREKSGKNQEAKKGRVGKGLAKVENPDVVITHTPTSCNGCGSRLDEVVGFCAESRQIFDIPEPKVEVTEYQVEEKKCPCCGEINKAVFPENACRSESILVRHQKPRLE